MKALNILGKKMIIIIICHHVDNHENYKLSKVRLLNVGGRTQNSEQSFRLHHKLAE
jgi:hypothetical protein